MTRTSRGFGCLLLFASVFALVGAVVLFLSGRMLWSWVETRHWQKVPARILHVDLEENRGDDSTTYEVLARYQYQFGDRTYEGTRVSLGAGADNVGTFHQDKYRELSGYQNEDRLFRCWVDPDDPSRSLLYRDMRWGLFSLMALFGVVFGGVGFGVMFAAFWGKRNLQQRQAKVAAHPGEPWLWEPEWTDGRIRASGKTAFLLPALMAVFWNLVSAPLLFLVFEEALEGGPRLVLLALIFPAVGFGLLIWAGRAWVRWRKFGDSVLELSTLPGVIGGRLTGRIISSVDLRPARGFDLILDNVERVTRGSGDNRRTTERILWQEERHSPHDLPRDDPSRSEIPVDFRIPFDASASEQGDDGREILWRLRVAADVPGIDYTARFEVPVFRTGASRPDPEGDEDSPVHAGGSGEDGVHLVDYGIDSELLSSGGQRLTFRTARHKGPALGLTGFLVLWLGFNCLLIALQAPLFFSVIWCLFSLLLLFATLDVWFERRTIEIHAEALVLQGGLFGLGKTREIPRSQIADIRPIRGLQANDKLFYRIQVATRDGKKHIAATKLDHLSLARHVITLMEG